MEGKPRSSDSAAGATDTRIVKIVLTDDQLECSLDMFPSESAESDAAEPAAALEVMGAEQIQLASHVAARRRTRWARRSTLRPALGLAAALLVIALLDVSAILRRNGVPARSDDVIARVTSTAGAPATPAESQPSSTPAQRTDGTKARGVRPPRGGRSEIAIRSRNVVVATRPPARASQAAPVAVAAPLTTTATTEVVKEPALEPEESRGVVASPPPPAPVAAVQNSSSEAGPSTNMPAITAVLNRYQQAFSRLDAGAAKAVWPSVDVKALGKAFDQLDQQTFDLQACDITAAGARAKADCNGNARYIRKLGNRALRVEPRQWRFTLRQINDEWVIETVDAR
jgi:hypothetical protein